jgi:hypothetical protein
MRGLEEFNALGLNMDLSMRLRAAAMQLAQAMLKNYSVRSGEHAATVRLA